jgi:arsenate reductase
MAEAFLNNLAGERFEAESAGIEPGQLNPIVVDAMKEIEIDISKNKTKDVFEFYKQGRVFKYVITVCDKEAAERCPVFLGVTERLHWSFPDPSALKGGHEEKMEGTRKIRDQIKNKISEWILELKLEQNTNSQG